MKNLFEFYDGHPGSAFVGAMAPLPSKIKEMVDSIDGQKMTLEEAVKKIDVVARPFGAVVGVEEDEEYISLTYGGSFTHFYRLISYRKIEA